MKNLIILFFACFIFSAAWSQKPQPFRVIAYYSGGPQKVDSLPAEKLSHIIFSFCHLKGNKLAVDNATDSLTIRNLVGLKKRNPKLKVLLSLGGWGGCKSCSDVFSTEAGRKEFTASVVKLNKSFKTDGLDLDWEYPAISGYPGHPFKMEDRRNFTLLCQSLRKGLGKNNELTFAAGGFSKFLEEAVEWKPVMEAVDFVNMMTYDLVSGFSTVTGHHTALYSSPSQKQSTDNAVSWLLANGIPSEKIIIGAAFYSRIWENVQNTNNGLYQSGKFKESQAFRDYAKKMTAENGFAYFWDDVVKAPYAYNATEKLFATFDDEESIRVKTEYALNKNLGGIMFWEISHDKYQNGLVDKIYQTVKASSRK